MFPFLLSLLSLVVDLFVYRTMDGTEKVPREWVGGLNVSYHIGGREEKGGNLVRLKIGNTAKTSSIYNVVASIPGWESDR